MPPPTTRVSTLSSRASMTPSLSLTLAPPRTATNGRAGSSSRPPRTSTSLARRRPAALGRRGRRADDRGVGPVGGAEGVVDVEVEALDQAVDEGGVVGLLARVEAEVLQQLDAGRQLGQPLPHRRPPSTSRRACPWAGRGGCRRRRWRPAPAATRWWAGRRGCAGRRRCCPSVMGTLKSARSRTRLPDGSGRSSRWGSSRLLVRRRRR